MHFAFSTQAARGIYHMSPTNLASLPNNGSADDIEAVLRATHTPKFNGERQYADAKLIAALYVQQAARVLPSTMRITCVSPGATGGTDAGRHAKGVMKLMVYLMNKMPGCMGAHSVPVGAQRYVAGWLLSVDRCTTAVCT